MSSHQEGPSVWHSWLAPARRLLQFLLQLGRMTGQSRGVGRSSAKFKTPRLNACWPTSGPHRHRFDCRVDRPPNQGSRIVAIAVERTVAGLSAEFAWLRWPTSRWRA